MAKNEDKYGEQAMHWYGWGSPVGLGLISVGVFLWLLHLANLIKELSLAFLLPRESLAESSCRPDRRK